MKDTLITVRRKKTELITWLVCFFIANLLNLYAIFAYHTPLTELFTSFFYVLVFACVLYVSWSVLRLLFYSIKSLIFNY